MYQRMIRTVSHKIIGVVIIVCLSRPGYSWTQGKEHFFITGNSSYQEGDYQRALVNYQKVIENGYESGAVYYNMGNCYYKLQDIGRAILFYERAKRLIPADEDLKANLALANLAVVDKITQQPEFLLFRIVRGFTHLLPKPVLLWVVMGSYLSSVGCFIVWIVTKKYFLRRMGFRIGIFLGFLFLVLGLSLIGRMREEHQRVEGIILIDKVDVMSAPSEDESVEVFSLHEGTKVRIDQRSGEWIEIILADGKVGWVKDEVLEII